MTPGSHAAALMVVRAWRDGPGPAGVRARVWRAVGVAGDLPLSERLVSSLDELEGAVRDWLELLRDEDGKGDEDGKDEDEASGTGGGGYGRR